MTVGASAGGRCAAPRVGLFGLLGTGNIGNDASMEAVLGFLRRDRPDATLDAMCAGPDRVRDVYGIEAVPLFWHHRHEPQASAVTALALKALGKCIDTFKTVSWVRRHDVVIVPGMGVLEASLPLRPWEAPYSLFLLGVSGRLFGTKVAFVSVGANVINQRLTRWLVNSAARLAFYRSYRDTLSRDAMRQRGLDTTRDHVFPDLVFGLPPPPYEPGDAQTVGIGVMAYYGTNDDRRRADEIHLTYVETMKSFVRWLVEGGRRVRLLVGDESDERVVGEILADLREHRPGMDPAWVVAEPVASFAELMKAMAPASTVVATRYHNVMCALKLGKPAISLGYAAKNVALMADAGLSEFCQSANSPDLERLIEQFRELEVSAPNLTQTIMERNAANAQLVDQQFAELNRVLFPALSRVPGLAEAKSVRTGA